MVLADWLSRFPSQKENLPTELHQHIQHIHFSNDRLNVIRGTIECNPIHNTLYHMTLNGWPKHPHQVLRAIKIYWGTRAELLIEEGLLIKGNSMCIPPELYDRILTDLHESHQVITKMQLIARATVYWL